MRWLAPSPTEEEYAILYDQSYFSDSADGEAATSWMADYPAPPTETRRFSPQFKAGLAAHNERMIKALTPISGKPGRLLEIGCGHGEFLLAARDAGWSVAGIEPSEKASGQARDQGIDVFHGRLDDNEFNERFDAIYLSHVFEHLMDPQGSLDEIATLLKPGGVLVIVVPNQFEAWVRRLAAIVRYRRAARTNIYSIHHPIFYGPSQLGALLTSKGFTYELQTHHPHEFSNSKMAPVLKTIDWIADRTARQGTILEFTARLT